MNKVVLNTILFLIIAFSPTLNAQVGISKKSKKIFKKGIKKFNKHDYISSIDYFNKVISREPDFIRPHLYKASAYYELNQFENSRKEYLKILEINQDYNNDIYYSLGLVTEKQKDFEKALEYYTKFLDNSMKKGKLESKAKTKVKNLPFIIIAVKNPVDFEPIALDKTINSNFSEYLPSLTGDNLEMIFTRRINRQEDLFYSKYHNGKWQESIPIKELNTRANEGVHTLSLDGKTLIFTVCARGKTFGNCDLFISKKINNHWSKPKNMGATINSPYWDSQPSISSDNKTLYFSSNRPGGIGGRDIWVSHLQKNHKWSKPICLDSTVNTRADEQTPFIHADNTTLYFTSAGHPGMGGTDLYYSELVNGKWSKAVNLGYPINTEFDEGALFVTLAGKSGYFSADRSSHDNKNIDIYYFEMPEKIKPKPVTYVKGIVFDKSTNVPIKANIKLANNNTGKFIQLIQTDLDSFLIALPIGIDYNFSIQKPGFVFYSDRFVLDTSSTINNPIILKIGLEKITDTTAKNKPSPVVLNNVFFDINSPKINISKSKIELEKLYSLLEENKKIHIKISGHTDNTGTADYNKRLSLQRAKAVYDYLVSRGISTSRLEYAGYGETRPVASNDTPENRSKNRRVEFVIYFDSKPISK